MNLKSPSSMPRKGVAAIMTAALSIAAPGLPCYQAMAQSIQSAAGNSAAGNGIGNALISGSVASIQQLQTNMPLGNMAAYIKTTGTLGLHNMNMKVHDVKIIGKTIISNALPGSQPKTVTTGKAGVPSLETYLDPSKNTRKFDIIHSLEAASEQLLKALDKKNDEGWVKSGKVAFDNAAGKPTDTGSEVSASDSKLDKTISLQKNTKKAVETEVVPFKGLLKGLHATAQKHSNILRSEQGSASLGLLAGPWIALERYFKAAAIVVAGMALAGASLTAAVYKRLPFFISLYLRMLLNHKKDATAGQIAMILPGYPLGVPLVLAATPVISAIHGLVRGFYFGEKEGFLASMRRILDNVETVRRALDGAWESGAKELKGETQEQRLIASAILAAMALGALALTNFLAPALAFVIGISGLAEAVAAIISMIPHKPRPQAR